jgi:hypothetical protein
MPVVGCEGGSQRGARHVLPSQRASHVPRCMLRQTPCLPLHSGADTAAVLLRLGRRLSRDAGTVGHFPMLPSGVRTCPNAILVRTNRSLKRQVSLTASNLTVLLEGIELLQV